jgi:uncharacterized membrane protein YkvA (DUF1232 family)
MFEVRKETTMTEKKPVPYDASKRLVFLTEIVKRLRLVWLLFWDGRVSLWIKSVLPASLLYLISPVDFVPDVILGLGQLDDLSVILLGMALFVKLCPQDIVREHLDKLEYGDLGNGEVVDTSYQVVDED